jgi:hypothetical protein
MDARMPQSIVRQIEEKIVRKLAFDGPLPLDQCPPVTV